MVGVAMESVWVGCARLPRQDGLTSLSGGPANHVASNCLAPSGTVLSRALFYYGRHDHLARLAKGKDSSSASGTETVTTRFGSDGSVAVAAAAV
jgi:hypothetical protein